MSAGVSSVQVEKELSTVCWYNVKVMRFTSLDTLIKDNFQCAECMLRVSSSMQNGYNGTCRQRPGS